MFRKNYLLKEMKGVSKQIRNKFTQVLDELELDLRIQNINKQENRQKMQSQLKRLTLKVNRFSNMLLNDNFQFASLQDYPLIMIRYCQIIFEMLIDNFSSDQEQQKLKSESHKTYNQNNVYEVVAALKLENFDLKQKIKSIQKQFQLAKQRAQSSQKITLDIQSNTETFLANYESNFGQICDLLKKAENNQIQLLQNNRYLKQELQSLSIQFERYKQYFKQGPSLKQKEYKIKSQLQKQYEIKLRNVIRQVQTNIKNQVQWSIREKIKQKLNPSDIKNLRF